MFKKIILAAATFAIVCVAYQIYQWRDDTLPHVPRARWADVPPPASTRAPVATRPADAADLVNRAFTIQDARIPSGQAPVFRMYDRRGNARIMFRASGWQPVSDNEFEMVEPTARLLLPSGQLAYVRADQGRVTVQKGDNNNLNPKRGWFRGHVSIFIDLTKPKWREDNPELVEPEQHAEAVVKIWLDDVRFDLDLTRLESDGPILLQSTRGTLEGRGLTLIWNEVDNRLKYLKVAEGKRATLHNVELASLALSDEMELEDQPAEVTSPDGRQPPTGTVAAVERPVEKPSARPRDEGLAFLESDEEPEEPRENRVDTYRISFTGNVTAEQKKGVKAAGRLTASVLELLCDLGREERDALEQSPATQPSIARRAAPSPGTEGAAIRSRSTVELHWTGPLEITPAELDQKPVPAAVNRVHVLARGSPVRLNDRDAGDVACLELEYHAETERLWLRGSPDQLVTQRSGPHQQLAGERIYVDKQARLVRVEGPGRLLDRRADGDDAALAAMMTGDAASAADENQPNVKITWSRSVQIQFGISSTGQQTLTRASLIPKGAYLEHAVFDGDVTFAEPGRSITADHVDVTCKAPDPATGAADQRDMIVADRILAAGGVHMTRQAGEAVEHVSCDRLEVDMTLDDTGRNVPKVGRAFGHVVARQVDRPGRRPTGKAPVREIRAEDELVIEMASVPKTITDAERKRYQAKARQHGIEPGSLQWTTFEQRLRDRRKIITTRMLAKGEVAVHDREQELDLAAALLDCTFGRAEDIRRALIHGSEDKPAYVDLEGFFIRGPQISIDMTTQSAEVPGAGTLRFLSKQDLDGRPVDEPIPVAVTWEDRMLLQGQKNVGRFTGAAHAVSETLTLDCNELQLRFEDLPRPAPASTTRPAGPDPRWIVGPILDSLRSAPHESTTGRVTQRVRKRLAYLHAVGDAVIQSTVHNETSEPGPGPVARWLTRLLPGAVPPAAGSPRLSSRIRLAGPQIAIDLVNEHLGVEGAGNLFIEDYRWSKTRRPARSGASTSSLLGSASAASLDRIGPSQTLFEWQNSMLFVNTRNLAVFEDHVDMTHWAGSKMAELDQLAAAMNIDPDRLRRLKGRQAGLTCGNLLVEFERGQRESQSGSSPLSRATRLKSFQALGRVRLEEGNRFVIGTKVTYSSDTGVGQVIGSPQLPAKLYVLDERTGQARRFSVDTFEWDQRTGLLRARDPRGLATSK